MEVILRPEDPGRGPGPLLGVGGGSKGTTNWLLSARCSIEPRARFTHFWGTPRDPPSAHDPDLRLVRLWS